MSRDKAIRLHAQAEQYIRLANQCWQQNERMPSIRYAILALDKEEHAFKLVTRDKTGKYAEQVVAELIANIVVLALKLHDFNGARLYMDRATVWPGKGPALIEKLEELEMLFIQYAIAVKGGASVGTVVGNDSLSVSESVADDVEVGSDCEQADDRADYEEAASVH